MKQPDQFEKRNQENQPQYRVADKDIGGVEKSDLKALSAKREEVEEERLAEARKKIEEIDLERNPFAEGEIFDPDAEVKNLLKVTGEKRQEGLEAFKKKLRYQKLGLARIETFLWEQIEKNPETSVDELFESIGGMMDEYALPQFYRDRFQVGLRRYSWIHKAIFLNTKDFINERGEVDGKSLYRKFFRKEPTGDVDVVISPIAVGFRPHDFEDYAYVYSGEWFEGVSSEKVVRGKQAAENSRGVKIIYSFLPELKDAVFLQKPGPKAGAATIDHEMQHVYNASFEHFFVDECNGSAPEEKRNNDKISKRVKDEISAYFKGGRSAEVIHEAFLDKDTIYDYGMEYDRFSKKYQTALSERYIRLVEEGLLVYDNLLKNGYQHNEVCAVLLKEPLEKWRGVAERLFGDKKSPEEWRGARKELRDRGRTEFLLPTLSEYIRVFTKNVGELMGSIRTTKSLKGGYEAFGASRKKKRVGA